MLEALLEAGGDVVSARRLLDRVWDENIDTLSNTVRMTVMTLRKKLGQPAVIETVRGWLPHLMRPRPTIRLKLTALYAVVVFLAGGLLLAVSYALLDGHLHNTLSDAAADDLLAQLRDQYVLALFAVTAFAVLLGWVIAGRALAPLRAIATAARAVSGDSLTRRVALRGPDDELRELADTFDEMLERLDSAFASQKRFVADASHELRTLLTVLRTEVEVALADPDASAAELRATAEVVREEVQRFEALLESLLALARSEARALATEEPVDLADVARRVVSRLQPEAAMDDVLLTVKPQSAIVNGDRGLLEQLVFNLVDNAVTHNCSGGFAEVWAGPRGEMSALRVVNSGARVPTRASSCSPSRSTASSAGGTGAAPGWACP